MCLKVWLARAEDGVDVDVMFEEEVMVVVMEVMVVVEIVDKTRMFKFQMLLVHVFGFCIFVEVFLQP